MIRMLFILILCGCSKDIPITSEFIEDYPEYYQTRTIFESHFNKVTSHIVLHPMRQSSLGACSVNGQSKNIRINYEFWIKAKYYEKKSLLFHELVHCELGIGHFGHKLMSPWLWDFTEEFETELDQEILEIKTVINMMNSGRIISCGQLQPILMAYNSNDIQFITNDINLRIQSGEFYMFQFHNCAYGTPNMIFRNENPLILEYTN